MHNELVLLAIKGMAGGVLVVVFASLGEVIRPRAVAGVTSAAPSVALASLFVTATATGVASAAAQARGMVAGAAALVICCLCGLDTLKRFGALRGSILATMAWLLTASALWVAALR